jgi:hypothetical protein
VTLGCFACSGDDGNSNGPDAGSEGDGSVRWDGGLGSQCPSNTLGCPCEVPAGAGNAGTCESSDDLCLIWNEAEGIATCVRVCTQDQECQGATVAGNPARPASLCRNGLCVESSAAEGEACRVSAFTGEPTSACDDNVGCFFGLTDAPLVGSCGRACANDTACVNPAKPYCNLRTMPLLAPNVVLPVPMKNFVLSEIFGNPGTVESLSVCSDRPRPVGSFCRLEDVTAQCDGPSICSSIGLTELGTGHCLEWCDPTESEGTRCQGRPNSPSPSFCGLGFFLNGEGAPDPTIGVCHEDCTIYPDSCKGEGSEGRGLRCSNIVFGGAAIYSWCWDVREPLIREYPFQGTSSSFRCDLGGGDVFRCPDNTTCFPLLSTGGSVCVRGCDTMTSTVTTSTVTGCANTSVGATQCTNLTEFPTLGGPFWAGVCAPPI